MPRDNNYDIWKTFSEDSEQQDREDRKLAAQIKEGAKHLLLFGCLPQAMGWTGSPLEFFEFVGANLDEERARTYSEQVKEINSELLEMVERLSPESKELMMEMAEEFAERNI